MGKGSLPQLKIDPEFRDLIRPLLEMEYQLLEESILKDGCRDPIIVWNGVIVDGHNRYRICTTHSIPFKIREINFESREEAVAWICHNQLGRRNLSEESRKYLIGKEYNMRKIINEKKNALGINQHTEGAKPKKIERGTSGHVTAVRIGNDNHISHSTVLKYGSYATTIDALHGKTPEIVPKILGSQYKLSQKSLEELVALPAEEIREVIERADKSPDNFVHFKKLRSSLQEQTQSDSAAAHTPSIKSMPTYDPDAVVVNLSLTVPSWVDIIERAKTTTEMVNVSAAARERLKATLHALVKSAEDFIEKVEG